LACFDDPNSQGWSHGYRPGVFLFILQQVTPAGYTAEQVDVERKGLLEIFSSEQLVDTLLFQLSDDGHSGVKDTLPFETLLGSGFVNEELLGVKFTISPTSFFQVNTSVAELMYGYVRDQCTGGEKAAKPSLLLDLCCGTGTIGQLMASAFDKVVGIDIVESAIQDARDNAIANKIENVEYHAGKVVSPLLITFLV
jgi:tRNA (uracil-5-)-methyltransferase